MDRDLYNNKNIIMRKICYNNNYGIITFLNLHKHYSHGQNLFGKLFVPDKIGLMYYTSVPVSESLTQTLALTNRGTFLNKWSQLGPDGTEIRISSTP